MTARLRWLAFVSIVSLAVMALAPLAHANTPQAQFHIGRVWINPDYNGVDGWNGSNLQYPGGMASNVGGADNDLKRGWVGQIQKFGSYLFTTDWTDPEGTAYEYASSYFFRSMNYNFPTQYTSSDESGNMNYLYAVYIQEKLRWERPEVIVVTESGTVNVTFFPGEVGLDSMPYKQPDHAGVGPRPLPVIDPTLMTEEVIDAQYRFIQGLEYNRQIYGYSYGTPHQDYVLWDAQMVNNGICGNVPEAPTIADQTLNNVVWLHAIDYRNKAMAGDAQAKDTDALYTEPWGADNHVAVKFWDGDCETVDGPDFGDPVDTGILEGHLAGNCFLYVGPLFVSSGTGSNYGVDDAGQPGFRMIYYERGLDDAGKPYSPPSEQLPPIGPITQRTMATSGQWQMPLEQSYRTYPPTMAVKDEDPGPTALMGYGTVQNAITAGTALGAAEAKAQGWPTIGFGESVRIVLALCAGGIDVEESRRIGAAWVTAKAGAAAADTWMSAADQALVATGNDTALKAAALAYWNVHGEFAANVTATELAAWGIADYPMTKPAPYGEFDVPDGPRPPGAISVSPKTDKGVEIRWGMEAETALDQDLGIADFAGYRVYRQAASRLAPWQLIADVPAYYLLETAVDSTLPAGRILYDNSVTPGTDYWYCVTAYDDGAQNWVRPGVSQESTRWWTWTGYSHIGVTAASVITAVDRTNPDAFALGQNAPNPFNPTTTINFSVPSAGDAKLAIYNTAGQLVRTLIDGSLSAGAHKVTWDGKDNLGRSVATGVYMYRLTAGQKNLVKRMTLVR